VDAVKIDRAFIATLSRHPASSMIVLSVVGIAHVVGMKVVAEGIETLKQYEQVAKLGCDSCQGFYFARPMPAGEIDALLAHPGTGNLGPLLPAAPG
jgi:EAL domain-containing protein (putative c-di-GMP-specific phosphodiesterase class I)